ncbi:hypothetical protein L596_025873 [Steinernema carpocapsae]|uniref:Uncharacterized protein n=1 Tax=Steinernema carpocapsae TaxID=34508 RepID=A0A4U5M926_STECR|nr:hypothetical protein L596_025873 [Steinernema carpocapsae]
MEVTEEFAPAVKKTPKAKATIPALFDEDISKTVKKKATKKRIEELVEEADIDISIRVFILGVVEAVYRLESDAK